jgi:GNAT superfamily N-acetyltransferase
MNPVIIREVELELAIPLMEQLPEFDHLPSYEDMSSRINHVPHLVLLAQINDVPAGFKIGYERDGRFYSWLGGVLPAYRQMGIATALANRQEEWAKTQGYTSIWMKTRNRFPEMLLMAVRRGFRITAVVPREKIEEHRIVLAKSL